MFTGSTKNPPPKSPQPERLDEVYAALRRGLQSYLQVHQLELDSLGQQIRESKRNGRLGFLYELDKQVKAIERFMRRLEFHLSKVEELYDAYCMQRRLRDGASKMVAAFNSASGSKEARESLSEANRGYREYTEHMCSLESELEGQMGEFHIKMKGLAGFARLCAGDQYEVLMRAGRQRWRLRGRVEGSGRQVWDSEEYVFLPLITELLSIKVTELKSLANHVVVGSVSCETLDLFCPLPQTVAVDINDLGTVKLNLEVTWSPFDKDDQTSSTSTVSKRFLSNQSPPDTPSMREQVFYSLLKRQGELENGTVWSNSSESSDDSSSPAMGHHAHRMMATPTLQTTPTIQISFNPRQSSASTPSLSSNQEEDEPEAAEGLGEVDSVKWAVPNGHQCSRSLSHIDDTSVDSTVTGRPLAQSPGLARTPEPLGQSHPEGSCSGQKSEALDLPECDASGGFRADSENPGGMAQAPVLQATDSALGKGLREEQSSKKDNQRQQSTQPQELGQGLRLPEETLKGYHSRSSSFSQDIETALESFDFLNCSDLDDEEGEEEKQMKEDGEEEEQLKEEEEELKKEEESIDYAESQECEGEEEMEIFVEAPEGFRNCDCAPPDEDDCSSQPQENTGEEATWQDEEEEEDKDKEEWKEGEKEEDKEEWEEEVKDEKDKREEWEEKNEEEKDQKEGQVEEEKEEWEEKKEEEKDKKEGWVEEEKDKKEEQEVEQKDKKEEQENVEEEEETQREKDEEKEEEITETDPSKQEHGEETFHDEEARPSTPSHLATTVL